MDSNAVWFTWEDHRRSRELSNAFGAKYLLLFVDQQRFIRYPVLIVQTFWKLLVLRPKKVFCQNPSIVLAFFLVTMRPFFGFRLIVDRHSNFKFEHESSKEMKWRLFWFMSRFTVKFSDLTIVTNDPLRELCEEWGGRAFVLPDKLPDMSIDQKGLRKRYIIKDSSHINVMCVTTFGGDEPIDEIIESASLLGDAYHFYLTGKFQNYVEAKGSGFVKPENVTFTGFISESDYRLLLNSADVVVVLTTKNLILNCGAYEAVSVKKPLVLSNTETLRGYFRLGAIFVDMTPESIAEGVREAWDRREEVVDELSALQESLETSWFQQFQKVSSVAAGL